MGPQVGTRVARFNARATGAMHRGVRLKARMGEGGILDDGNAEGCVRACPRGLPVPDALAEIKRKTLIHGLTRWARRW